MAIELTPEQRQAVLATGGAPLHIHDPESQKVFVLIEQGVEPTLDEEYIRSGLELARNQIQTGEHGSGDIEALIELARSRQQPTD